MFTFYTAIVQFLLWVSTTDRCKAIGSRAGIVRKLCGHCAVSAAVLRNCMDIVRLCDRHVFWGICAPNVYKFSFLIDMVLKMQRVTETPADSNSDNWGGTLTLVSSTSGHYSIIKDSAKTEEPFEHKSNQKLYTFYCGPADDASE